MKELVHVRLPLVSNFFVKFINFSIYTDNKNDFQASHSIFPTEIYHNLFFLCFKADVTRLSLH